MNPSEQLQARTAPAFSRNQIILFLLLTGIAWGALNLLLLRAGGIRSPQAMPIVAGIMWTPGLAAIATRLLTTRNLRGLGWRLGEVRWLGFGYLLPFLIAVIPFLLAVALGAGSATMKWWPQAAGHLGLPASPLMGFIALATVNVLFATIGGLGEELGWRGFLVPALAERLRFPTVVALTWAIWFVYHLPAVIGAGYDGGVPLWFALPCFGAMLMASSTYLAWLRLKSGSIWPCALAHGAHNAFIQEMFASALQANATTPWITGEFGIATALVSLAVTYAALRIFR